MGRGGGESDDRVVDAFYTVSANTPRHLHLHRRSGLPLLSLAQSWSCFSLVVPYAGDDGAGGGGGRDCREHRQQTLFSLFPFLYLVPGHVVEDDAAVPLVARIHASVDASDFQHTAELSHLYCLLWKTLLKRVEEVVVGHAVAVVKEPPQTTGSYLCPVCLRLFSLFPALLVYALPTQKDLPWVSLTLQ